MDCEISDFKKTEGREKRKVYGDFHNGSRFFYNSEDSRSLLERAKDLYCHKVQNKNIKSKDDFYVFIETPIEITSKPNFWK